MEKTEHKGKVVYLPTGKISVLSIDKESIGVTLEGKLVAEVFAPYINKEINIILTKENGKVKQLTIEEL